MLIQAHVAKAAMLVVATPDPLDMHQMAETARKLNPGIEIVLYARSEAEAGMLRQEGMAHIFIAEEELAQAMTRHVLGRLGADGKHTAHA